MIITSSSQVIQIHNNIIRKTTLYMQTIIIILDHTCNKYILQADWSHQEFYPHKKPGTCHNNLVKYCSRHEAKTSNSWKYTNTINSYAVDI